ncbi:MAG TPA: head GIN domain-containing protein [Sediminibacterium sp.]|nr:head GIN domain-containing protein [Sediminibacterium sp.]
MKYLASFLLIGSFCLFSSCRLLNTERIRGNGHVSTAQRSVTGFTGVSDHGSLDVVLSQGDYKVTVEADENIIPHIVTAIEGDKLIVRFEDNVWVTRYAVARVHVTAPSINRVEVYGSGNITSEGAIRDSSDLQLRISGSGDMKLQINKSSVDAGIYGSGNMILSGTCATFSAAVHGSGDVRAFNLQSQQTTAEIYGSGNVETAVSSSLKTAVHGSGDVRYKGSPAVNTESHGSGSVVNVN